MYFWFLYNLILLGHVSIEYEQQLRQYLQTRNLIEWRIDWHLLWMESMEYKKYERIVKWE